VKSKATAFLGLVPMMCLYVFSATAAGAGGDRVLITDPAVLESMGAPRDATHVYRSVKPVAKADSEAEAAGDFGTGAQFTAIAAKSFIGRQNTAAGPWQYDGGEEGCCTNLSRLGAEAFADAPLNLPNGALLTFIRYWANDTSAASDLLFFLFETCYPNLGPGATNSVELLAAAGGLATTGATGNQSDSAGNLLHTINNQGCKYTLRVNFEATTGLTLQKMRAQWQRQISPAPAVASFTDVPTGAQFFQEVEALAASGITLGCTASTFCPENFVTRRQMAAFLSRALGL
jgi:S-layer homology domain